MPSIMGAGGCDKLRTAPPNIDLCPFIGDSVTFQCTSTNVPSSSLVVTPPGVASSLYIASVNVTHSGTYTCQATNECGRVNSSVNVQVFGKIK